MQVFNVFGAALCGLNSDWSCQASHCAPVDTEPNRTDGGAYVLDNVDLGDSDAPWLFVERWYLLDAGGYHRLSPRGEGDGVNDITHTLGTTADPERACAVRALLVQFDRALRDDRADASGYGAIDASNLAFTMAQALGWDWESDTDFMDWALKATGDEILIVGRRKACAVALA